MTSELRPLPTANDSFKDGPRNARTQRITNHGYYVQIAEGNTYVTRQGGAKTERAA